MKFKILNSLFVVLLAALLLISCGEPQGADEENTNPEISADENKGVPVEAAVIKTKTIQQNLPFTGVLEPINSVDIVAEVSGKVEKINKELGSYVTTQDVLAYIDDRIPKSNYEQAKAQVLSAENNLRIAELTLASDKELLETGDISKLAYENSVFNFKSAEANLLAAKANLSVQEKAYEDTKVQSPIAGLVSRKNVELGTMVNPGSNVYRVVDIRTLKVDVGVPQSVIGSVKEGGIAEVLISGIGNGTLTGVVKNISPQADESTGSFQVEIHVKNKSDMRIRAGMTANINLVVEEQDESLVVPDYSIVQRNGSSFVYKIIDGFAKLTEVKLGKTYGSQVEVYEGLSEGDEIVIVGMKNLGVNTKVWIESVN